MVINTPNGSAPPLVTGTFGGADFLHSLMGEATDHLSQSSITDLSQKLDDVSAGADPSPLLDLHCPKASKSDQSSIMSVLKTVLSKIPQGGGGSSSQMAEAESIQAESKAYHFNPDNIAPPEVQKRLWSLLKWRDGVFRGVSSKIEAIPGLESLIDSLTDALNACTSRLFVRIIAQLAYSGHRCLRCPGPVALGRRVLLSHIPVLTKSSQPILKEATSTLSEGSKVVINSADQYEVFNNPNASDPSHSLLSKVCRIRVLGLTDLDLSAVQDHFALILNEPVRLEEFPSYTV